MVICPELGSSPVIRPLIWLKKLYGLAPRLSILLLFSLKFVLYDSHNALVLSPKKVSKYLYIVSGSVS